MAKNTRQERIEFVMMLKDTVSNTVQGVIGFFLGLKDAIVSVGNSAIFIDRVTTSIKHLYGMFSEVFDLEGLADTSRQIQDFANYIGISTDKLQAWQAVASNSGISMDDTIDAFATFNDRVDDFLAGTGYVDEFLHFGFTKDMFKGLDVVDQYLAFGDRMLKMTANERLAVSSRLLGDQINKIFGPLLTKGGPDFARKMQEAMNIGMVLTTEQLDAAREYKSVSQETYNVLHAMRSVAGANIAPLVSAVVKDLLPAVKNIKSIVDDTFGDYIKDITDAYKQFMVVTKPMRDKVSSLFEGPGNAFVRLFKALIPTMTLVVGSFAALAALPILLWATAFMGLIIAVEDFIGFINGDDSMIEDLLVKYPQLGEYITRIGGELKEIWSGVKLIFWQLYVMITDPATWEGLLEMLISMLWFFKKFTHFLAGVIFLTRIVIQLYGWIHKIESSFSVMFTYLKWMSGIGLLDLLYKTLQASAGFSIGGYGNKTPSSNVFHFQNNLHGVGNPVPTSTGLVHRQRSRIK